MHVSVLLGGGSRHEMSNRALITVVPSLSPDYIRHCESEQPTHIHNNNRNNNKARHDNRRRGTWVSQ